MTNAEEFFVQQLGLTQWELVTPSGNLWKAKGKKLYVRHRRLNIGACAYLRGLFFIKSAEEAGGRGVILLVLK